MPIFPHLSTTISLMVQNTMTDVLIDTLFKFWDVLKDMSPYLLFGFFVAGFLSIFISPAFVEQHLGGKGLLPTLKASLLGVPLPLCSCGVIPVAASLRRHGASRGATAAFLLSTPQTGVDSILVTLSLLGPLFAAFRPIAAFIGGVLGGIVINILCHDKNTSIQQDKQEDCSAPCCNTQQTKKNPIIKALSHGFVTLPADIARSLIIGLIIAGFISAIIPDNYFIGLFGTGLLGMFVMMLCGIPLYVCATASIPIAVALIEKGISPGAAWVFLTTGPATNAATIMTMHKMIGKRAVLLYLGTVVAVSFGGGIVLNYIYASTGIPVNTASHMMIPDWAQTISALLLIGVLVNGIIDYKKLFGKSQASPKPADMERKTFFVSNMTCSHCAQTIHDTLVAVDTIQHVDVNLKKGSVTVDGNNIDESHLCTLLDSNGYPVQKIISAESE